jgi:hypothetical protein
VKITGKFGVKQELLISTVKDLSDLPQTTKSVGKGS